MKGVIIYNSKTENTAKMAKYLYEGLSKKYDMDIFTLEEAPDIKPYDFGLVGSWIDKGTLEPKTLKFLQNAHFKKFGLFGTLGVDPESKHGHEVNRELNELYELRDAIGVYLCPGKIDEKFAENLDRIPESVLPKDIAKEMEKVSDDSREATQTELKKALEYFEDQIRRVLGEV